MTPPSYPVDTSSWTLIGRAANMDFFECEPHIVVGFAHPGSADDAVAAQQKIDLVGAHFATHGRGVVISFMDGFVSQDAGARRIYRGSNDPLAPYGVCVVTRSLLTRAMASFFLGISRPIFPVKVTNSFDVGRNWARELLEIRGVSTKQAG